MKKATYREIPALLEQRKAFEGNSVTAYSGSIKGISYYEVYSYKTLIYREHNGVPYVWNTKKYSVTTSKIQNILKRVFGLDDTPMEQNLYQYIKDSEGKLTVVLNKLW